MKRKVGIITFHAAHNYGSCLQAYALQSKVEQLGFNAYIINLRTERQKDMYRPLTKRKGLKYLLKNAFSLINLKKRKTCYDLFENFISAKYHLTQEYESLTDLNSASFDFDFYISGSDQIWNTVPYDADMSYFLPFVKHGVKIAYAPSFGQIGNISKEKEIAHDLADYNFLSAREESGCELIRKLCGRSAETVVDPTLFYNADFYEKLIDPRPIINRDYIFFYTLFATPEMMVSVKRLSKMTGLPVVTSNVSNQYDAFSGFEKHIDCGPCEFLNLLKNAKMVFTSSFHCTVFSIIFKKDFYAFKGMDDKRISSLLKLTSLENRSVDKIGSDFEILPTDFHGVNEKISASAQRSEKFLCRCLGCDENEYM